MINSIFAVGLAAVAFVTPASAFIRFGCANNLVETRADPIVSPGVVAKHAHKIAGGNGFAFNMNYDQARASQCSSCPIKEDMSNYWTPKLYIQYANGTFQSVPTVGDNANDLNGGMTVYYLQRGDAVKTKTLKAFPKDFRMFAGDSLKRSPSNDFAAQAINFACLDSGKPETNGLPNYNCPGGLRAQVFFPSCWDGHKLDSDDHKSHMSYPSTGAYNNGGCPSTHPVQLVSLFFEILYDTNIFKNEWSGGKQPFVFANGDATGYGFHGDFVNGWDVDVLQRVVNECDDPQAQGVIEKCGAITTFSNPEQNACRQPSKVNEAVAGSMSALPGCNPVTYGPEAADGNPTCAGQIKAVIGNGPALFTDVTAKGWGYSGCATDGTPRTLTGKTTVYSQGVGDKMTVESCIDTCKDYTYAGLEYAGECWCGNSVPADRAPKEGILGNCNMKCKGNTAQFCGGAGALSLYKKCSGGECKNAGSFSSPVSPPASPSSGGSGTVPAPVSVPISMPAASQVVNPVPVPAVSSKASVPVAVVSPPAKAVDAANSGSPATVTVTVTKDTCSYKARRRL